MSIIKVFIIGNLTRDPEVRQTQSGVIVMSFTVAVNERIKRRDNWEDSPSFIDCTMFGTRAEKLAQYLAKGKKVVVEGKLRQITWQTQEGAKRSKFEVIVDDVEFMSAGQKQQEQHQQEYTQPTLQEAQEFTQSMYDEEIPF